MDRNTCSSPYIYMITFNMSCLLFCYCYYTNNILTFWTGTLIRLYKQTEGWTVVHHPQLCRQLFMWWHILWLRQWPGLVIPAWCRDTFRRWEGARRSDYSAWGWHHHIHFPFAPQAKILKIGFLRKHNSLRKLDAYSVMHHNK